MVERRKVGLFKKAQELSVLCDVEVGIVMYAQNQKDPIVWPSMELATQCFTRFLSLPESEKVKKMVTHEKYLRDRIDAEVEKIKKKERENEKKEMNILMSEIINGRGLNEMDARQLKGLYIVAGEKMQELEKRRRYLLLKEGGDTATAAACSYHGPSSAALKAGQSADDSYNKNKMALLVGGGTSLFIPTLPGQGGGGGSYGGCRQLINNYSFTDSINPNNGGDGSVIGKEAGGSSSGSSGGCHQLINNYSFTGSTSTHPNNGGSSGNTIEKEGSGGGNNGGSSQVINNYSYTGSPSMNHNNDSSGNIMGKEGGGGGSGGSNNGGCHEPTTNYSYIGSPSINTSNGGNGGVIGNEGGGFPTMELPNVTSTSNTSPSLNQVWPYNFFSS
ncbi:unnamed protein product [Cuscuta campestris]|uniref:MADS-box domain-containing protein n=1 Tax=Cuscuta campestris TaxID=132261 RepID=A0A484KZM8_9ASTE|nr:unnamed protein product [Cuscuta campestris]